MEGQVFTHRHRVIYAECTIGNHVYYSRYLDILEEARGEFFRHTGCAFRDLQDAGMAFPVIALQISYKGMARYDDLLAVELWFNELGGIRLSFGFRILNAGGSLLVEGETRHICASLEEKPMRLSKEVLEKLKPYLHSSAHAT